MFHAHLEPSYWAVMVPIDERGEWAESQRAKVSFSKGDVTTKVPIPDDVVKLVSALGPRQKSGSNDAQRSQRPRNRRRLVGLSLPHYPVTQLDVDLSADDLL
jgi:hypothetical protein